MKRIIYYFIIVLLLVAPNACEFEGLQKDPNALEPKAVDPTLLLNNIQLAFASFFINASVLGMDNTRMVNMFGTTYDNAYTSSSFNVMWISAYSSMNADIRVLLPLAEAKQLFFHAGIARVLQAYVLVTLVDYFGEVPLSSIGDGSDFNPGTDKGEEVYNKALEMLDQASGNIAATSAVTPVANDLYYSRNKDDWQALINTLKLKIHLQRRLVDPNGSKDAINKLIADNKLIDKADEDFVAQFGTNEQNPDARHPFYTQNYLAGASEYMSNYYMDLLINGKSIVDPRLRYYFYRQQLTIPTNPQVLGCINVTPPKHYGDVAGGTPYCFVLNADRDGYWGRDHLNGEGIPPDTESRTIYGVYPAGGAFDSDQAKIGSESINAKGEGIAPIMLSSFTYFMLAEAALTLGTTGDASNYLERGIKASLDKVTNFKTATYPSDSLSLTLRAKPADLETYTVLAKADFTKASGVAAKLDVLVTEYLIALFGNGVEAYNTYRRTGAPSNIQPALSPKPGKFYRSFTYPAVFADRNSSVSQKTSNDVKVFWDKSTANFDK